MRWLNTNVKERLEMFKDLRITNEEIAFGVYGALAGVFALGVNLDNRGKFLVYSAAVMFGVMCMIMRSIALRNIWKETKSWFVVESQAWPMVAYVIGTLAAMNQIKVP